MLFRNKIMSTILFAFVVGLTPNLFADALNNRDHEAVTSFINSKRTIDYAEKHSSLKITGDTRVQWQCRSEIHDGVYLRGHGALSTRGIPIPENTYEAQVNIRFDYKAERTWGAAYMQFSNGMGTGGAINCNIDNQACGGSGECSDLCIKRAFWGYNILTCDKTKLDIEIGRRPMYTIFDSRIQYHARFDGILLKLADNFKGWGEYYIKGAPFVIDYDVNHYGYVTEAGVLNFKEVGIDFKYSFIDWVKKGKNRCLVRNARGWMFKNSQWALAYNFEISKLQKKAKIYSAILVNHAARRLAATHFKHENLGWYVGMIIGEVKKEGDWSFDMNYQYVEAQAVADCDVHGIGRGNLRKETFPRFSRGKANYKGCQFQFLYAITDKLSFDTDIEIAHAANSSIGGRHQYKKFELDLIYAF